MILTPPARGIFLPVQFCNSIFFDFAILHVLNILFLPLRGLKYPAKISPETRRLFCVTIRELAHNAGQVRPLGPKLVSSGKRRRIYPLDQMSLSSQLRADLESIAAALAVCESILAPKADEQEAAEWLENFSRWAD